MKKFINYTLSTILTLSAMNVRASDEYREQARANINKSKQQAKTYAEDLVKADFSSALMETLMESYKAGQSSPVFQSYLSDISTLESRVEAIMNKTNQNLSGEDLIKIWDEYKEAVRKRFEISYQAQTTFYDQSLFLDSAQSAIDKFKNVCETGRSQKGIKFYNQYIPNLPPVHSEVMISYDTSDGSYKGSSSTSTSTGKDNDRKVIGTAIEVGSAIIVKVATSGGAGQMVAACQIAAPYAAAAVVAYAIISGALAAHEQRALQEKITEANLMLFRESASDNDVSKYYRETCNNILPIISQMQSKLKLISSDETNRLAAIKAAEQLAPQIATFEASNAEAEKVTPHVTLFQALKAKVCKEKVDADANTVCFKSPSHFVLAEDESIQLPLDEKAAEAIAAPMIETLHNFGKQYPRDLRGELISAKVVLALGKKWETTSKELETIKFEGIDKSMSSLFTKLQGLFTQLRADKEALWNQKNPQIAEELAVVNAFENLKTTHRNLVNEGIKVIFNRTSREAFQKKAAEYIEKARAFGREYSTHKEVKSFTKSVEAFSRLYKNL